jgi:hypothetical protein
VAAFLIGVGMAFLANPEPNPRTLTVAFANGMVATGAYLLDPRGAAGRLVGQGGRRKGCTKTKDGVE